MAPKCKKRPAQVDNDEISANKKPKTETQDNSENIAAQDNVSPTVDHLPKPSGTADISSNYRAGFCGAQDHYNRHQGAVHSKDCVALGMLVGEKTTPRDILTGQVLITTVGGGLTNVGGTYKRTMDQTDKAMNYRFLKNAMDKKSSILLNFFSGKIQKGVRITSPNSLLKVQVPYIYSSADFFHITDLWLENDKNNFKQYSVRLEKVDRSKPSWWIPEDAQTESMFEPGQFECPSSKCNKCNESSMEIFTAGWCCLQRSCAKFFDFSDPNVENDSLRYSEAFLNKREDFTTKENKVIVNPLPSQELKEGEYGTETKFKISILCRNCHLVSERKDWLGYECEKCGWNYPMPIKDIPMEVVDAETKASRAFGNSKQFCDESILTMVNSDINGYEITTLFLPNSPYAENEPDFIGFVSVIRPSEQTRAREGGVNDMWMELQRITADGTMKMTRHAAYHANTQRRELTANFSNNMGADYKFGVVVETSIGLPNAPQVVLNGLSRLAYAGKEAIRTAFAHILKNQISVDLQSMPENFEDQNEILTILYRQEDHISPHDDGEKELGPTVCTLSLGSPGVMTFRPKKCWNQRTDGKDNEDTLSFIVEHGDIVVMHGTKIHRYYEHAVEIPTKWGKDFSNCGRRRAALTTRHIHTDMITDPERRKLSIENGELPDHMKENPYMGEL
ncbi:hypothetical protein F5Y16DRAFT_423984 [Xylariaceae sp. FL0255]|nr:hypothetical protein F5Y16DRAFT_423984 [Xylariaceae sp. FL0255]